MIAKKEDEYFISTDNSQRIDILKIWLTIMVLYIHSYSENINMASGSVQLDVPYWLETLKHVVSQCISRCAVPTFFFLSALLLYRKPFSWKENIRKKINTLLIPYIIINSFWIAFFLICQQIPILSEYFSSADNIVMQWGFVDWLQAYGIMSITPLVYPLWFVKNLFLLNIFSVIIGKMMDKYPNLLLGILGLMWLLTDVSYFTQTVCFWGVGCYFAKQKIELECFDKLGRIISAVIYALLIVLDVLLRESVVHDIVHRVCILVGGIFFFVFATKIKREKIRRLLLEISQYVFCVYLLHEMILTMLKKICVKVFPITPIFQLIQYIGIPILIFVGCLILSVCIKKYMPKVYIALTGGRNR